MPIENVCKYHNVGFCKYKDKCMFLHSSDDCDQKCKINAYIKRHRKICKHGENCKYKQKCEFKHDRKSDANDKIYELNIAVKELLGNNLKNEEKIMLLEQNVKEIKADKQYMTNTIVNLSAEIKNIK